MTALRDTDLARRDWLAAELERHRAHLRSVGYRMLGSITEADDAISEAWIRLQRRDPGGTGDLRGWLTVTVGRICLDMLRTRASRRETYAGTWLPEPVVTRLPLADPAPGPEEDAVLAESVGIALLVVLERLAPAERIAFVLHDVFGVPFEAIAPLVDRTPAATRQLASRARRRVRGEAPDPDADVAVQAQVVEAFLAAARDGDGEALLRVLHPDVEFRGDGGGGASLLARAPIQGRARVAAQARLFAPRFAAYARPAIVNGEAGVVIEAPGQPRIVAAFSVRGGRIVAIDMVGDPAKTRRVR